MPLSVLVSFLILMELPYVKDQLVKSDFLMLIAILFFNTTSFFFIIAHNFLVERGISTKEIGIVHFSSNIIYYSLFLISILLASVKTK
jgi:hypothetical protein